MDNGQAINSQVYGGASHGGVDGDGEDDGGERPADATDDDLQSNDSDDDVEPNGEATRSEQQTQRETDGHGHDPRARLRKVVVDVHNVQQARRHHGPGTAAGRATAHSANDLEREAALRHVDGDLRVKHGRDAAQLRLLQRVNIVHWCHGGARGRRRHRHRRRLTGSGRGHCRWRSVHHHRTFSSVVWIGRKPRQPQRQRAVGAQPEETRRGSSFVLPSSNK